MHITQEESLDTVNTRSVYSILHRHGSILKSSKTIRLQTGDHDSYRLYYTARLNAFLLYDVPLRRLQLLLRQDHGTAQPAFFQQRKLQGHGQFHDERNHFRNSKL